MANNCLKTKLKASVANENLPYFGTILATSKVSSNPTESTRGLTFYGPIKMSIIGDGYFISADPGEGHWTDGTNSIGKTFEATGSDYNTVYVSNHVSRIIIFNKYDYSYIVARIANDIVVDINDFQYNINNLVELTATSTDNPCDLISLLKKKSASSSISITIRNNMQANFDLLDLLDQDITCTVTYLDIRSCPNITGKTEANIDTIKTQKWPNITILV